ncbi:MAG: phosphatidylglycerol lysyltransferase domain-containing protein, partial [Candidatus Cloacimonadaceae bacterium]|nr:phosphatidylglycerol lysyltransferase domain-containing protein [Candidatus Cloacimonadaceae bacterium]
IHFEKFDPDKKGSAQTIFHEAAKFLAPQYKWINREQDMDLDGLRQAKRSYLPDRMINYYTANLR